MRLPLFIAGRYLFSKRNRQAINIISWIAVTGVALGTAALVIVLSVFNGFEDLVSGLYTNFDPNIKLLPRSGKYMEVQPGWISELKKIPGVSYAGYCVEDHALVRFEERQNFVEIKGYPGQRIPASGLSRYIKSLPETEWESNRFGMIPGAGVAASLGLQPNSLMPAQLYAPNPDAGATMDAEALISRSCKISGLFSVQQEYDSHCIILPFEFAAELMGNPNGATALEVFIASGASQAEVEKRIRALNLPLRILNRYELHADVYKIMKTEKMAVFLILTFILLIAAFNITSSLTMLIIEKNKDVQVMKTMGASHKLISRIFMTNGLLITAIGAIIGAGIGLVTCILQKQYGLVKLYGSGSFIIRYYPVKIIPTDLLLVVITVICIGFFASRLPVFSLKKQQKIN